MHIKYFAPLYVAKRKVFKSWGRKAIDEIENLARKQEKTFYEIQSHFMIGSIISWL